MTVDSYLNEPLRATLPIANIDADSLGDIKVSLADLKSYKSLGLSRPAYLPKLTFRIEAGEADRHVVHITSQQRIREPILEVLVKVTERQSNILRLFTFLMDPPENEQKSEAMAPVSAAPVVSAKAREVSSDRTSSGQQSMDSPLAEATTPIAVRPDKVPEQPRAELEDSITVGDRSISLIAQNSSLHLQDKHSVYQIMRAFYLENSDAFSKGNIGKLRSGSTLRVPGVELITEVTRQQAVNFVYAASKDYPFDVTVDVVKLQPTQAPLIDSVSKQQSASEPRPKPKPAADPNLVASQPLPVSQNLQADLIAWRAMSEEFKSLSEVVQSQNKVIKVQSEVMKDMTTQLDARNNEYLQLDLRLDALETSGQPLAINDMSSVRDVRTTLSDHNRVFDQQNERLNDVSQQLALKSEEITQLHQRIAGLEQQGGIPLPVLMPDQELLKPPKPAEIIVLSPATEVSPDESLSNSSKFWLMLILAFVLLLVAIREFSWRRRLQQRQDAGQSILSRVVGQATESKTDEAVVDEGEVDEDEVEGDPVEISMQSADTLEFIVEGQKQEVITNISIPESDLLPDDDELDLEFEELPVTPPISSSRSRSKSSSRSSSSSKSRSSSGTITENALLKDIYTEIDVFIAYELYSEAKKLLDSARSQFGQDHWLDIKELEILAHSKSADIFFSLFEDHEEQLSEEFPIAWKKIMAMKEKLSDEFQKTASL